MSPISRCVRSLETCSCSASFTSLYRAIGGKKICSFYRISTTYSHYSFNTATEEQRFCLINAMRVSDTIDFIFSDLHRTASEFSLKQMYLEKQDINKIRDIQHNNKHLRLVIFFQLIACICTLFYMLQSSLYYPVHILS